MTQKLRPVLLIAVCMVLGVLVWLDSAPDDTPQPEARPPSADIASGSEIGPGNKQEGMSSEAGEMSETQEIGATAYQTDDPGSPSQDSETDAKTEDDDTVTNPLSSLGMEELSDTVDRPLFAPTRKRPPPQETGAPEATQKQEASYDLLGVALGGSRPIAIMRKKADGKSFRVEVGDTLSGWHVTKVEAREVHLERNGSEVEIVRLLRK